MSAQDVPYNPLDKANLSDSVVQALVARPVTPLGAVPRFNGAGLYLNYYTGETQPFPAYQPLAEMTRERGPIQPIYAGMAVRAGGRRGVVDVDGMAGTALYDRLADHGKSISQAQNLALADFHVRYLTVDDTWINHAEGLLLRYFRPLWNQVLDGFGNHDPGSGRYSQRRSYWDTLHPGRAWAVRCADSNKSAETLLADIAAHMAAMSRG